MSLLAFLKTTRQLIKNPVCIKTFEKICTNVYMKKWEIETQFMNNASGLYFNTDDRLVYETLREATAIIPKVLPMVVGVHKDLDKPYIELDAHPEDLILENKFVMFTGIHFCEKTHLDHMVQLNRLATDHWSVVCIAGKTETFTLNDTKIRVAHDPNYTYVTQRFQPEIGSLGSVGLFAQTSTHGTQADEASRRRCTPPQPERDGDPEARQP